MELGNQALCAGSQVARCALVHVDLAAEDEEVEADAVKHDSEQEQAVAKWLIGVAEPKAQVAQGPCNQSDKDDFLEPPGTQEPGE